MKEEKNLPFTKDDYFKMLDGMLRPTSQTNSNPLFDRLRMAAQKISMTALSGTAL